ncbi:MAG TPA: glycerophosphodiester phosphodiesterase [Candidatus Saccharimonadales bacterium]|nr:glycerophosphodiester phosphodiesterase [Candidatus Saccharimonadales bacterium]
MKIIGHRGARGLAPENTIAGMKKGLENHVDELEFDLRVTKDNIVILHHDRELHDSNSGKHKISESTYQELLEHKSDLATFAQVFEAISQSVKFHIEVKPEEALKPIISILNEKLAGGWPAQKLLIGSKSQNTLLEIQNALPDLPLVVIEPWSGVRAHLRARKLGTKRISMNQRWLWWGFIRGFKRNDWRLYAYTLNDPVKAKRWAKYGLYGVITDYPDRFESKKI